MAFGLPSLGNVKDILSMKKQADEMKKKMESMTFIGVSKKQQVKVTIDGTQEVKSLEIADELMSIDLKDFMVKQILEAMEDARKKFEKDMVKNMDLGAIKDMLGGLQQ